MIVKIGYSGSRDGMTKMQMLSVYRYLAHVLLVNDWDSPRIEFHHGDCAGGDAQAHVIATVLGCYTIGHPPSNPAKRAWCLFDEIRTPKDYLARDWDIANETSELLATPKTTEPQPRSGTWTTIGYAVQLGRLSRVFLPNGYDYAGGIFFGAPLPAVPGGGQ